jgi:hypothetical protein
MTDQTTCLPCAAADEPTCPDPHKQHGVTQADLRPESRPRLIDDVAHRPLMGGYRIAHGNLDPGTLGFLLWDPDHHDVGYIVTAQHLFGKANPPRLPALAAVGQPSGKETTCRGTCSGDIVGQWLNGQYDPGHLSDQALIRLTPGTTWKAEIAGIGPVRGTKDSAQTLWHDITPAEIATGTYPVMKRGQFSGLTGGVIDKDHSNIGTYRITPNPPATRPSGAGETYFSVEGDSGSALLNDQCQLVGLVVGRIDSGSGIAYSMKVVMQRINQFAQSLGLKVEPAVVVAGQPSPVHTVPAAAKIMEPVS